MIAPSRYSYREDGAVPPFDDSRPVFDFDGACVHCSGGASFIMRHDPARSIRFVSAQSSIGSALYTHYGKPVDESYLLLDRGELFEKTDGYLRLRAILGGPWQMLRIGRIVPRKIRDAVYAVVAAKRYRWFGRAGQCALLSSEQRAQLLEPLRHWPTRRR
jgi:predicted DCC family thiol-disulfide oxidoreductase YuxK